MEKNKYKPGEVYYRVSYSDVGMKYPTVETFVFSGKNFFEGDAEDTWYFQFLGVNATYRSLADIPSEDRRHCRLTKDNLSGMLDLDGLTAELKKCEARRLKAK